MSEVLAIDDCWNRIGVRGDNSCARLQEYFRCLNCPTFAAGASALLDRAAPSEQPLHDAHEEPQSLYTRSRTEVSASMLVFRIGAEWLGLPTTTIVEVIEQRTVHSLPHQANAAVLGLTNIRGALKICVALGRMLGIDEIRGASTGGHNNQNGKRALVVEHEQQILVFPVDEVAGVHGYGMDTVQPPPSTLQQTGAAFTREVVSWRAEKVGLLDCGLLFYALNRSLT